MPKAFHPGQLSVAISAATLGNNEIVPVLAGKKIRVLSLLIIATAANTIRFESSAGGTALTGQMALPANGGFSLTHNPGDNGWFTTVVGENLNLELSAALQVSGVLNYDYID